MSTTPTPTPPNTTAGRAVTDDELQTMAEQLVDALLSSASVDTIGALHWWDRAKTALETAAASSTTWAQCVARAARKLQIETLTAESSATVAGLARVLDDPAVYQRWARQAARDAIYTVALVRAAREQRRTTRAAAKNPTLTHPEATPTTTVDTPSLFGDNQ